MPGRRYRRSFARRPRRKTRWLSIVPGAIAGPNNNEFRYSQLNLQDRAGAVSWSEFYGATLLRVILDVQLQHTSNSQPGPGASWFLFSHAGIFITPDTTPEAVIWDPNVPSGSFMERQSYGEEIFFVNNAGSVVQRGGSDAYAFHFDTNVSRRIGENDLLFLSLKNFFTTAGTPIFTGVDYGYTGRVLIALP